MRAAILLAALLAAAPISANSGDIDGSGMVDSADVLRLRRSLEPGGPPLTGAELTEADVAPAGNPDEVIDERDLSVLLRMMRSCPEIACIPDGGIQNPDCSYQPVIAEPSYPGCVGPRVRYDETRDTFHELDDRYSGFAKLLAADGYEVRRLAEDGPYESFDRLPTARFGEVLVIAGTRAGAANAVNPSQVAKIASWIANGGSLLATTDHFDYDGPVRALFLALGVVIDNGQTSVVVGDVVPNVASPLAAGVSVVSGNGGSGLFPADPLPPGTSQETVLFLENSILGPGAATAIAVEHGAGRAFLISDASIFSAQVSFGVTGLSAGADNERLLLNVMHWLDGTLEAVP